MPTASYNWFPVCGLLFFPFPKATVRSLLCRIGHLIVVSVSIGVDSVDLANTSPPRQMFARAPRALPPSKELFGTEKSVFSLLDRSSFLPALSLFPMISMRVSLPQRCLDISQDPLIPLFLQGVWTLPLGLFSLSG